MRLGILEKVEVFLGSAENIADVDIIQASKQLIISLESIVRDDKPNPVVKDDQETLIEYAIEDSYEEELLESTANDDLSSVQQQWVENKLKDSVVTSGRRVAYECDLSECNLKFFTYESMQLHLEAHAKDEGLKNLIEEESSVVIHSIEEFEYVKFSEEEVEDEVQPAKKRKLNTLNDLTDDQINWIRQEVAAGEIIIDKKRVFKCTVCEIILSTQASLTRHLRDVHMLKSKKGLTDFKAEVKSSKLNFETSSGNKTIWKCLRCENDRIYKSEQAFKLHLRMEHVRGTKVDTAFIAACKTTITETNGTRNVWQCPDCERIFRHRDTLRNHIKLEHPNIDEVEAKRKILEKNGMLNNETLSRIAMRLEETSVGKSLSFCNECGLKFATSKHHMKPKVHKEAHETFKTLAQHLPHHKCDSCRMIFNSEVCLDDHLLIHDDASSVMLNPAEGLAQFGASFYKVPTGDADDAVDEAVWKCAHCPVRYFDSADCVTHILLLHSSPINCFIDNREFTGSSGMSKYLQHMKNKHPELFPNLKYACGGCKQEFLSIYEKLEHQKLCSNKKFQCDYCGKFLDI